MAGLMFDRRVSARMEGTVQEMFGRYTRRGQTETAWTVKVGTGRQEVQRRPKRRFMVLMCCSGDP